MEKKIGIGGVNQKPRFQIEDDDVDEIMKKIGFNHYFPFVNIQKLPSADQSVNKSIKPKIQPCRSSSRKPKPKNYGEDFIQSPSESDLYEDKSSISTSPTKSRKSPKWARSSKTRNVSPSRPSSSKYVQNRRQKYTCNICQHRFTQKSNLTHHKKHTHQIRNSTKSPLTCFLCDKSYKMNHQLKYHQVSQHSDNEIIRSDPNFDIHLKRYQNILQTRRKARSRYIPPMNLECPHCQRKFSWDCQLKKHLICHQEDKPFVCSTCGSKYKSPLGLKDHKSDNNCEYMLKLAAVRKFKCDYLNCDTSVQSEKQLRSHKRKCHGILPEPKAFDPLAFTCLFCGYMAKGPSNLIQHTRTHTGEKPYSCKACFRGFGNLSNLYAHIRHHCVPAKEQGLKPEFTVPQKSARRLSRKRDESVGAKVSELEFQCSQCSLSFANIQTWRSHEKSHGDTFLCPFCPTGFLRKEALFKHKIKFHPEKIENFECKFCDKMFRSTSSRLRHQREVHKGQIHRRYILHGDKLFINVKGRPVQAKLKFRNINRDLNESLTIPDIKSTAGSSSSTSKSLEGARPFSKDTGPPVPDPTLIFEPEVMPLSWENPFNNLIEIDDVSDISDFEFDEEGIPEIILD